MPLIAPHTMLGSHLLAGEPVGPHASRQVILHITGVGEHRSHQQVRTEHVLAVQRTAGRIIREFHEHRTHDRSAVQRRLQAGLEQIRHERKFELGERAGHIHSCHDWIP